MASDVKNMIFKARARVRVLDKLESVPKTLGSAVDWGTTAHDVGWTEEKLDFEYSVTTKDVHSGQDEEPIYSYPEKRECKLKLSLREWTLKNLQLACGGGKVTTDSATPKVSTFEPSTDSPPVAPICLDWTAMGYHYRLVIRAGQVKPGVQADFGRAGEASLPLEISGLGLGDGKAAWYLMTDNPAMIAPTV